MPPLKGDLEVFLASVDQECEENVISVQGTASCVLKCKLCVINCVKANMK